MKKQPPLHVVGVSDVALAFRSVFGESIVVRLIVKSVSPSNCKCLGHIV